MHSYRRRKGELGGTLACKNYDKRSRKEERKAGRTRGFWDAARSKKIPQAAERGVSKKKGKESARRMSTRRGAGIRTERQPTGTWITPEPVGEWMLLEAIPNLHLIPAWIGRITATPEILGKDGLHLRRL